MRTASVGFQCPECVAEGRRTVRAPRTAFGGSQAGQHGYVTITLIGLNVLVALVSMGAAGASALGGGGLVGGITPLHAWGSVIGLARYHDQVIGIATGEYWRLFTAMFLHFGLLHLLVNMWALWILGRYLERALGPARFLALYLIAGLGGSVAAYLVSPNSFTAGASGAIFGLFAALFVVNRKLGMDNRGVIGLIAINLALGLFIPNISMAGHVGGLVIGGLVALGFAYAPRAQRTQIQVATAVAVLVLLLVLTVTGTSMILG
jgi:membrane associated rhomboid family serine protease